MYDDTRNWANVDGLANNLIFGNEQKSRFLIANCEAQRQFGETSLNDRSSRSHQIIRLTIECSSLYEESRCGRYLLASLSLVDLAGCEAQTNADGTRLKEGSHINRSLLTLTTMIRKLSGWKARLIAVTTTGGISLVIVSVLCYAQVLVTAVVVGLVAHFVCGQLGPAAIVI
ncbi:Kinesin, motor domain-containing protein, partial [Cynara cardunculus var. scolymus]